MKLGFRAKMPDEMQGKRIRVQAVFTQRQVERRFPMEVVIEEGEVGDQIRADAEILLPYVINLSHNSLSIILNYHNLFVH